ncbi:MAG: ATP-binding protein [Firmicutes bacterium]|nr:ATP-binding protein [Bacillota bacterium]
MFYDRRRELDILDRLYQSEKSECFVLYGRRRVGKTELIKNFIRGKKHIYFMADLRLEQDLLRSFSEQIITSVGQSQLEGVTFPSWDSAFSFLAQTARQERYVVVLDEFQYLAMVNPAFPSILQRLWDEKLQFTKILLILCGSYVSFIEEHVLGAKSPLYGRRTAQLLLQPVGFPDLSEFFPSYTPTTLVEVYAVLGGMPGYLRQFDPSRDLQQNILDNVLSKEAFLYNEVRFTLMQELRDVRVYFSILKAIAHGKTKLNEIYLDSGLSDRNVISRYIATLVGLGVIRREFPVTEKHPEKSRKGIYRISDYFIRFWFRFVLPNLSLLEEGCPELVLQRKIIPEFATFVGPVFEDVCREVLMRANILGRLPFVFDRIGRWWDSREEVDIVAIGPNVVIFGECKWRQNERVGTANLAELKRKAAHIRQASHGSWSKEYYVLFSRNGFTSDLRHQAKDDKTVLLFSQDELSDLAAVSS